LPSSGLINLGRDFGNPLHISRITK
jgi:hypothetical protein